MSLAIYMIMVLLEVNWQIEDGRQCRRLRKAQSAKVKTDE